MVRYLFYTIGDLTYQSPLVVYVTVLWFHVKSINGDFSYIVQLMKMEHRLYFILFLFL